MIGQWIKNLGESLDPNAHTQEQLEHDAERVTAHILIEVARADFGVDDSELESIIEAIVKISSLDAAEIGGIVAAAKQEVDQSLSYHQHIKAINDTFEHAQKLALVEQMWRVAFADDHLDRYEEAFIRRFCDLVFISHKQFMQAKLTVTGEWKK